MRYSAMFGLVRVRLCSGLCSWRRALLVALLVVLASVTLRHCTGSAFAQNSNGGEQPKALGWSFQNAEGGLIVARTRDGWWLLDTGSNNSTALAHTQINLGDFNKYVTERPPDHAVDVLKRIDKELGVHVKGIIGQDILRTFKRVEIDYQAKTITLEFWRQGERRGF